jgi:dTDP-4-amino-4,6-dideoxygalactose transaminase
MTETLALLGGKLAVTDRVTEIWPAFTEADARMVADMVRAGEVSYAGREGAVERLEEGMRRQTGARHALAVNSGTQALHSAFFGLEIGPGDEVVAPTYTFHATVLPVVVCNAVPVLADAHPDTGNIDPDAVERVITARTKAIVVMHLNGYPVDMPRIMDIARRHGLRVVEDCSQAHGAECADAPIGSFGDVAAFSLQSRKQVTAGSGGIMTTNDDRIFERAVLLGHSLDRAERDVVSDAYRRFATTGFGLNLRMHPLAAALAASSLDRLDELLTVRQANCDHLDAILDSVPGVRPPLRQDHMTRLAPYSHQPLYRAEELADLPIETFVRAIAAEGVPLSRPRTPPLHRAPAFQDPAWRLGTYGPPPDVAHRAYRDGDLPDSETYFTTALRMPVYSRDVRPYLDQFAVAFDKVARNIDRLHELDSHDREKVRP